MSDIPNLDHLAGRPHRDAGLLHDAHLLLQTPSFDPQTGQETVHHGTAFPDISGMASMVSQVAGRKSDGFTMFLVTATPTNLNYGPVSAFGFDPQRERAMISNTSPSSAICFGKRSQVAAGLGFLIPSNVMLEVRTQEEMYIGLPIGYTGATIAVGIYIERL